ncbi:TauD/TfdA dioxygenase family protein [Sphingobium mellinum]|uniref:TauD/TfdA dioxygenase family protein n=1 Tax=Sphingobium mellinum TaxID=1387166 RepID=UPI0030EBFE89
MAIMIDRLTPSIGAEITGVNLNDPLSDQDRNDLLKAFLDHHVLFFRDQYLAPQRHLEIARLFGEIDSHPYNRTLGNGLEGVQIVENNGEWVKRDGQFYTAAWHSDTTFLPHPYKGALLTAQVIPDVGGDTLWSNLAAAYDMLPEKIQHLIEGMEARHSYPVIATTDTSPIEHFKGVIHPVVRVHPETGRKSLLVNENFTREILGLSPSASQSLLTLLMEPIRSPETQVRFRWTAGSLAIWDNRCTAHYASLDYTQRRVMHRVTLVGDKPITTREWDDRLARSEREMMTA